MRLPLNSLRESHSNHMNSFKNRFESIAHMNLENSYMYRPERQGSREYLLDVSDEVDRNMSVVVAAEVENRGECGIDGVRRELKFKAEVEFYEDQICLRSETIKEGKATSWGELMGYSMHVNDYREEVEEYVKLFVEDAERRAERLKEEEAV